nr:MAG TPA: hypothetical protein [Caudoviricetes sp.]
MHAISLLRFSSEKAGNRRSDPSLNRLEYPTPWTAMPFIIRNRVPAELTQGSDWICLVLSQLWIICFHLHSHSGMVAEQQKEFCFVFRDLTLQFHIIPMLAQQSSDCHILTQAGFQIDAAPLLVCQPHLTSAAVNRMEEIINFPQIM